LIRKADIVVGQSCDTLANLRRYFTPEINGVLIPLAIRRPNVVPAQRAAYGIGEDETVLVTVGRLIARKNISHLLLMMENFRDQKVRLLVIGSGPLAEELQREVHDSGPIYGLCQRRREVQTFVVERYLCLNQHS
jgi:glycosyltransferase involved in cell wall biosynthesis